MARYVDCARLRCAGPSGHVQGVQGLLMLNPDRARQLEADWPELHAKLNAAFRVNRGEGR